MPNKHNSTLGANDPRGNDQNRDNILPDNGFPNNTGSIPFYSDNDDNGKYGNGEISFRKNFELEPGESGDTLKWLNSETELIRKIRQDSEKPNLHHYDVNDHKGGNTSR
jgi:hypothetical protein